MADLLSKLEASLTQNSGASERLRALVARIDEYTSAQRLLETPALVEADRQQQQQLAWTSGTPTNYDNGDVLGMDNQFSFQLPQELLVDWPWPLDLTQGFGVFQGLDGA